MNNSLDIVAYLEGKGVQVKPASSNNIHCACFFCGETEDRPGRLYINVDEKQDVYGLWYCHLCGEKGNFNKIRLHFGDEALRNANTDNEKEQLPDDDFCFILEEAADFYHRQLTDHPEVVDWLKSERGFTIETIRKNKLGYAGSGGLVTHLVGKGFAIEDIRKTGLLKSAGEDFLQGRVTIPYILMGQVIQIRGKEIGGRYITPHGQSARLFGADSIIGADTVVIAEGECFPADAEVMTRNGWVKFEELVIGEEVLQAHEDSTLEFVKPLAYVAKEYSGELIKRSNKQRFYSATTPGHMVPAFHRDTKKWAKKTAEQFHPSNYHIPRVGVLDGPGLNMTDDEIIFMVAMAADSSIDQTKKHRYARFNLKKERKIKRLGDLLVRLGIEHTNRVIASGYSSICFPIPTEFSDPASDKFVQKGFDWKLVTKASLKQKLLILDEQKLWDGNSVLDRNQLEFNSGKYQEIEIMQAIASTSGFVSTISRKTSKGSSTYKASILYGKQSTSCESVANAEVINYEGKVYCVTVPTGMILVRQNECIQVSGNCDAMHLQQMDYAAIGVPGANTWQDSWTDYLSAAKRINILFDNDKAGRAGAEKLASKLGPRARIAELPESLPGQKKLDVSDWVTLHGKNRDDFEYLFSKAGRGLLVSVREAYERWTEIEGNPNLVGLRFNIETIDSQMRYGLLPGQVIITLSKTNAGKTLGMINLLHRMSMLKPDIRVLLFSLEQTRNEWFERARRVHSFYDPFANDLSTVDFWQERMLIVDKNVVSKEELTDCIEQYVYEIGQVPDIIVVDYLGYFARSFRGEDYQRVSDAIMQLKAIAKEFGVVIYAPHQVNRQGNFGERVRADTGRSAGTVEETADMLMGLWAADQQVTVTSAERTGDVFMEVLKSRDGAVGQLVQFQFAPLTLAMVPSCDVVNYKRAKQERIWSNHGETWESALRRFRTGAVDDPFFISSPNNGKVAARFGGSGSAIQTPSNGALQKTLEHAKGYN